MSTSRVDRRKVTYDTKRVLTGEEGEVREKIRRRITPLLATKGGALCGKSKSGK